MLSCLRDAVMNLYRYLELYIATGPLQVGRTKTGTLYAVKPKLS
jgi:hypothetical protein